MRTVASREKAMQFTDNPNLDLDFTEYHRQEVFDLIEGTNPPGSCLVLRVDHDIDDRPGFSWDVEAHFYVVETTSEAEGERTWALFEISWDDNYGIWQRSALSGVSGPVDQDQAVDLLLNEYWEGLNYDEDDAWAVVLKPFRDRAAKIIRQKE